MELFWKIFFTIGAIWFVMLCLRPIERTREGWKAFEKNEKHRKRCRQKEIGFWVVFILFGAILYVLHLII